MSKMVRMWRLPSTKCSWRVLRHCSNQLNPQPNGVVIAAAVRTHTPNTPFRGEEQQLAGLVIDELVKRCLVPREVYNKLIICTSSQCHGDNESLTQMAKSLGLKSCRAHVLQDDSCSISGLQLTLELLQHSEQEQCIILGDSRCQLLQPNKGLLASELMTLNQPPNRKHKDLPIAYDFGAAALSWTTTKTAGRLKLEPLAVVHDFVVEENPEQALNRLHNHSIQHWNVVTSAQGQSLNLPELKRDLVSMHDINHITVSHLLTHLVHSLPAGGLGGAIMQGLHGPCLALVLKKLGNPIKKVQFPKNLSSRPSTQLKSLPQLTLYTKKPCSLCDELVDQLEQNFAGQFQLEKIYIDRKENLRYLRLFRYDIPVVFINGQFLCMHKLNEEALIERLAALKTS